MEASSKLIADLLNTMPSDDRLYLTLITGIWPRAVGEHLAARSQPWSWQGGRLTVAVPDAEWQAHLRRMADTLIPRLNAQLGKRPLLGLDFVINRARFPAAEATAAEPAPGAPGPVERPAERPVAQSECIRDPELQRLFRRTVSRYLDAQEDAAQ